MNSDAPPSSSPPRDAADDAILWTDGQPTGPVRLPTAEADAFISEFNLRYAALGIRMASAAE